MIYISQWRGKKRWLCLKKFIPTSVIDHTLFLECQNILQDANLLTFDSREIIQDSIWIPLRGTQVDGHDLLETLGEIPCIAFPDVQKVPYPKKQKNALIIPVNRSEAFLQDFISEFYDVPTKHLQVIGITGTNGKTSTAIFTQKLFSLLGKSSGSIGTLGARFNDQTIDIKNTTPDNACLQKILSHMRDQRVQVVAMEMSSHGLELERTNGILLDAAVVTNITQDHLDFHKTFEKYLSSKLKICQLLRNSPKKDKGFFLWKSCQEREKIIKKIPLRSHWDFSASHQDQDGAQVHIQLGKETLQGSQIHIFFLGESVFQGEFPLLGEYNYLNFAAAISVVSFLEKFSCKNLRDLLLEIREKNFLQIPGRFEKVFLQDEKLVIVDYAHTPDALSNILSILKNLPHKRILCLFGCGGDRDQLKREKMGQIASLFSDVIFLTSDNPRNENPMKIIQMIAKGVSNFIKTYQIQHRTVAIQFAAQYMQPGDILLVAGRGHESYQTVANARIPLDDRVVLQEFFQSSKSSLL